MAFLLSHARPKRLKLAIVAACVVLDACGSAQMDAFVTWQPAASDTSPLGLIVSYTGQHGGHAPHLRTKLCRAAQDRGSYSADSFEDEETQRICINLPGTLAPGESQRFELTALDVATLGGPNTLVNVFFLDVVKPGLKASFLSCDHDASVVLAGPVLQQNLIVTLHGKKWWGYDCILESETWAG